MAVFVTEERQPSLLDSMERLPYREACIDPNQVRVQESNGLQLVFFKDYQRVVEEGDTAFLQMVNRNGLDVDKIGIVLEEVDAINNPHYLNDAKHYVNPKKVYIRPMNTKRGRKMLETAIAHFELYDDPTLFDQFLDEPILEGARMDAFVGGVKKGAQDEAKYQKDKLVHDVKSGAKKVAMVAGGLYALNKVASHFTKKYADEDAKKHPYERSELIKKLRVLRGKLPEYESKYQRAEREKWENRGIIGKVIYRIKTAISNIMARLRQLTA